MYNEIYRRVIEEGLYIAKTGATVRDTAKIYGVGKSTVHKDVTERLRNCNYALFIEVKKILKRNLDERHIRGGLATQKKYQQKRNIN